VVMTCLSGATLHDQVLGFRKMSVSRADNSPNSDAPEAHELLLANSKTT